MSQRVDEGSIVKFRRDRDILPYDDVFIAEKMRMAKSNYSNYVNGRIHISKAFLKKFYTAFGDELDELNQRQNPRHEHDLIEELSKKNKVLEGKYDQLIESHHKIFVEFNSLQRKMDEVLKERLNKIEILLSHLITRKKNSSKESPRKTDHPPKHKKKPGG